MRTISLTKRAHEIQLRNHTESHKRTFNQRSKLHTTCGAGVRVCIPALRNLSLGEVSTILLMRCYRHLVDMHMHAIGAVRVNFLQHDRRCVPSAWILALRSAACRSDTFHPPRPARHSQTAAQVATRAQTARCATFFNRHSMTKRRRNKHVPAACRTPPRATGD